MILSTHASMFFRILSHEGYIMANSLKKLSLDRVKKNKINHHSSREHLKISKIANFGRKML